MDTYKLGNKVNCIIRAVTAGQLGQMQMTYDNQPYTELHDIGASLSFAVKNIDSKDDNLSSLLHYNNNSINMVYLSDCPITAKILDLVYPKSELKLYSTSVNVDSYEDGILYLPENPNYILYQVFVYDVSGKLVVALDSVTKGVLESAAIKANHNYKVFYSYETRYGVSLDESLSSAYVSLDLTSEGNVNDSTSSFCIHIARASISAAKSIALRSNGINTIDLNCTVIKSDDADQNYITMR